MKVKIVYQGEAVDAEELKFVAETPTAYLRIEDGAVIEFRHDVNGVFRLCDKKKPDGSPIYILAGQANLKLAEQPKDLGVPT